MPTDLNLANVSADDDLKVGALADGLASTATDKSDVDDSAVGVANASDSNNGSNNDSSTDTSNSDSSNHEANDNGDNRDNSYDYDTKVITATNTSTSSSSDSSTDDHSKTVTLDNTEHSYNTDDSYNTDVSNKTEDSYNSDSSSHVKDSGNSFSYADSSTHVKDSGNTFDYADSSTQVKDSNNSDSSSHWGTLDDVTNGGNLGIAGGDLNFHLGDDYSFNLNLDNVLNNALNGEGNDTGFTLAQANNLADQDQAYSISMDNSGAHNNLDSTGGDPTGGVGVGYDVSHEHHAGAGDASNSAGHDQSSSIDSSSILANSGYHQEIVQGANLVSNASDISITGGNDHHDTTSSSS
jgi:hypothetical protein